MTRQLPRIRFNRDRAIEQMRQRLVRDSFPRMQMSLLVALTGGFGLLASYLMLRVGLDSMGLRYPLALLCAYLFFLFLLWLWLRTNADDYVDVPDISGAIPDFSAGDVLQNAVRGQGGSFDGGGASANFDSALGCGTSDMLESAGKTVGDSVGGIGDADELAIPLIAIVLAVCVALASLYVVYIAPVLFAELLVDGALSYALFRHLRGHEPQHWLHSTIRRTSIPFMLTAALLCATGFAMSHYAPGAVSVGQVVKHARVHKLR